MTYKPDVYTDLLRHIESCRYYDKLGSDAWKRAESLAVLLGPENMDEEEICAEVFDICYHSDNEFQYPPEFSLQEILDVFLDIQPQEESS